MHRATKEFVFEEGTEADTSYKIVVYFRGDVVDTFKRATMKDAILAFYTAGYKRVE